MNFTSVIQLMNINNFEQLIYYGFFQPVSQGFVNVIAIFQSYLADVLITDF